MEWFGNEEKVGHASLVQTLFPVAGCLRQARVEEPGFVIENPHAYIAAGLPIGSKNEACVASVLRRVEEASAVCTGSEGVYCSHWRLTSELLISRPEATDEHEGPAEP